MNSCERRTPSGYHMHLAAKIEIIISSNYTSVSIAHNKCMKAGCAAHIFSACGCFLNIHCAHFSMTTPKIPYIETSSVFILILHTLYTSHVTCGRSTYYTDCALKLRSVYYGTPDPQMHTHATSILRAFRKLM